MENVKIACVSNPNTRVTDMLREQLANPNVDFPEIKLNCALVDLTAIPQFLTDVSGSHGNK